MSSNTHVPDKLEGYMLQVRHALFELIPLEDRIVSVEAILFALPLRMLWGCL